ncbi:MAG: L-threonylcarbamoyladenylate synthase [Pseudomonadota bacterium]
MTPMIIKVQDEKDMAAGLKKGAEVILAGGMVAIPTESFYGLAVNALDEKAVQLLLSGKKRGGGHPILILIPSEEVLTQYVAHIPEQAHALMKAFWPGGLTLVFQADPRISPLLTAGTGKIGVRLSGHPIATGLARAAGVPITGTSANISGQPPCMRAEEVLQALEGEVDVILDGGKTQGGEGSTVLDVTVTPPEILREGMLGYEALKPYISL